MCSVTEKPLADDLQPQSAEAARINDALLGPRRRKETLLPEITQLALEGHSSQAIAEKLGVPKRTVNHWLQEARKEWI
jgi:DNA-directed RNA polymerase specialized sigma24 family protein